MNRNSSSRMVAGGRERGLVLGDGGYRLGRPFDKLPTSHVAGRGDCTCKGCHKVSGVARAASVCVFLCRTRF